MKKKRPRGRPTKFTPTQIKMMYHWLDHGLGTGRTAKKMDGEITHTNVIYWKKKRLSNG